MPLTNYFLTLGHSSQLSQLELEARQLQFKSLTPQLVSTTNPKIKTLAPELAGITRVLQQVKMTSKNNLFQDLADLIIHSTNKNQAISNYTSLEITSHHLYELRTNIKQVRPVRFLSFETNNHSLIALRKQHVNELSIIELNSKLVIAQTIWIQDADEWSYRDRSRPYQDIHRGMLPPKLARLMVNLATQGKTGILLDPFCGTGTVLMEALLLGNSVVGSDNDQQAIVGSKANLDWLSQTYKLTKASYKLLHSDATHINKLLDSVDYVVTEPYLGPLLSFKNLPSHKKLLNIAKGLDKLYRGSLRSLAKVLVSRGRVVIVLPEFHVHGTVIPTLKIDTIASLGYNYLDSIAYSQPNAIVVRNITILEKTA